MIGNDRFSAAFGMVPTGDEEFLVKVAVAAVRQGFAVVVNEPGTKKPLCTLTAQELKGADLAAREHARETGDTNWGHRRHACGVHHALTDDKVAARVVRRLVARHGPVNLGIEPGRSQMLCVDVDTAAEKAAFLTAWSAAVGEDMGACTPTVVSPGKVRTIGADQERWVHKDGGHYWFTLPDGVDLAALPGTGILTADGGWVAIWRDKQVVVPPSKRAEGPYRLVGQVDVAPQWLLDRITLMAESYAERRRMQTERITYTDDPIDAWSIATPWAELLEPDGWTNTGLPDACDCPIWTRPGDYSSPKSATAHELGCTTYPMVCGHGPLHLWTDNPPEYLASAVAEGRRTLTKLQYMALRDYAGDASAAMDALELARLGGWAYSTSAPPDEPAEQAAPSPVATVTEPEPADEPEPEPEPEDKPAPTPAPAPAPLPTLSGAPALPPGALYGLAGQAVRCMEPHSEAGQAALLFSFLAWSGCYFGADPHLFAGHARHPGRIWPLMTGSTSKGRKGTATSAVETLFRDLNVDFVMSNKASGLSTSEGLIRRVRDMHGDEDSKSFDPGVDDKRLILVENEFATVLARSRRENNTISATLREAYDGSNLQTIVSHNPLKATGAHITVMGSITPEELMARLGETDIANGFANRFLIVYAERSKLLPNGGEFDPDEVFDLSVRFDTVAKRAQQRQRMLRTPEAAELWATEYYAREERDLPPGPIESMLARWAPHSARMSVIYALLDGADAIGAEHVRASLAAWEYVEQSVLALFNSPDADHDLGRVMEFINEAQFGRTRSEISEKVFLRNKTARELDVLLDQKLVGTGQYEKRKQTRMGPDGKALPGRPTTFYVRVRD